MLKISIEKKAEELKKELQNASNVYIQYVTGKATNVGRNDYFKILVLNGTRLYNLSIGFYRDLLGVKHNAALDSVAVSGYGYNKADHLEIKLQQIFKELNINIDILQCK